MPKLGRRSERSKLEVVPVPSSPRDGPYGNDFTPLFASRIVGGKHVPVLERPYRVIGDLNRQPRVETLYPVAEKPNYVDPKLLREYSKKFATNRSHQDEGLFGLPTTHFRRPDSKDIYRKYPTLPPINANKVKIVGMSTVFEPESWTKQYRNKNGLFSTKSSEGDKNTIFYDPRDKAALLQSPHNANGLKSERQTNLEELPTPPRSQPQPVVDRSMKEDLMKYLPRSEFLPDRVIRLDDDEEWELLKMIGDELQGEDPLKLRHVYIQITKNGDKQLSGWCHYKYLVYSLQDTKVNMSSDLLRIIAGQFINPDKEPDKVNYEKFLSFVGTALKNFGKSPRAGRYSPNDFNMIDEDVRPTYYDTKPVTPMTQSMEHIFKDREVTKLLSMIEQQLKTDGYEINFEKLISEFQYSDRDFRETLSFNQVKEVCREFRIPLTDSLLKQILSRCQDPNKDGQFNWIKFVYFLERVQPSKTGLYIPRSKQPLDYAKPVPNPTTEWPKPKSPPPITPLWRQEEAFHSKPSMLNNNKNSIETDRMPEKFQSRTEIERMDRDLKELEKNYEVMKRNMKADNSSPWFKRFMELANVLYGQDVTNSGLLPYDDVWNWTRLHNEACNLNIPDYIVTKTLGEASQSGRVNIHYFLTKLGNREWSHE